jgi:hypothetical protein
MGELGFTQLAHWRRAQRDANALHEPRNRIPALESTATAQWLRRLHAVVRHRIKLAAFKFGYQ